MIEPSLGYFTGYENGNWLFLLVSVFFVPVEFGFADVARIGRSRGARCGIKTKFL